LAYALLLRSGHKFERYDADRIDAIIEETAARHGADPALIKAIAWYESDYLSNAISTTGAMGLMALMPETARALGVRDPFDPAENIDAGVRLVLMLAAEFEGDAALILAGYNAGMGIVRRSGGVPPYPETTAYVRNVSRIYRSLRPEPLPPTASTALIRADDTK
jgi:soluble lytic murein transglycosylase-like protein